MVGTGPCAYQVVAIWARAGLSRERMPASGQVVPAVERFVVLQ